MKKVILAVLCSLAMFGCSMSHRHGHKHCCAKKCAEGAKCEAAEGICPHAEEKKAEEEKATEGKECPHAKKAEMAK